MAVLKMDEDVQALSDFRYRTLVEQFGKEEADKIVIGNDEEIELDAEAEESIENAPDWSDEE